MESAKYFLLVCVLFLLPAKQEAGSYQSKIYNAYIEGHMDEWKQTITKMQAQKNKSDDFILQLLNDQYGYIRWCVAQNKKGEANKYIEAAQKNIKLLQKQNYKPSYVNAYKSAIYAFIIDLSPFRAPFVGPKSLDAAKLAMKQDSTNAYAFRQYGHALYYMPSLFGGSKTEAIKNYRKAQKLMEEHPQSLVRNWNYLSLLTTIAKAYQNTGQYKKAYRYYQLILKKEPRFKLVKDELLPDFLKKYKSEVP